MEVQPQTRYNLKRLRKKHTRISISISCELPPSPWGAKNSTEQGSEAKNFTEQEPEVKNPTFREKDASKFSEAGSSVVPLADFLAKNQKLIEAVSQELYDETWREWRKHVCLQISLRLVDAEEMAKINAEFRGSSAPTDVLTFPLFEEEGSFVPPCGMMPLPLGDVVICPQIISVNAREHEVPEVSELVLVIFHGLLHLLAWDHDTPERERKMWQVQEKYRNLFLARLKETHRGEETH